MGILYDPGKEVYYRMAFHGLPDTDSHDYQTAEAQTSIIILDKHFRKVGESLLPAGRHCPKQWFVGPDGLYISNHLQHSDSMAARELSFTRYELIAEK